MHIPRFYLSLTLLVLCVSVLILIVFGEASSELKGGDGPQYHRMAVNIRDYGTVSISLAPPIEPTVYRMPGYSFFLTIFYMVTEAPWLVRSAQFVLLLMTSIFLFKIARLAGIETEGKIAAFLCATYIPFVFFCLIHLTETITTALGVILIWSIYMIRARKRPIWVFVLGLVLGSAILVRPSFSLLTLPLIFFLLLENKDFFFKAGLKVVATHLTLFILGVGFFCVPWIIRNYHYTSRMMLTSGGPESIYVSMLQYKGELSYAMTVADWQEKHMPDLTARHDKARAETARLEQNQHSASVPRNILFDLEVEKGYRESAVEQFNSLDYGTILKSVPKRLAYFWSTADSLPDWLYFTFFHRIAQIQWILIVGGVIAGIYLRRRTLLQDWPFWILPLYFSMVHLVFHVEARYSIPARSVLMLYCAIGLSNLYKKVFSKSTILATK
jgi:4-amino-4-deoxy-L-arabinose transferase-like glycosyltransferase